MNGWIIRIAINLKKIKERGLYLKEKIFLRSYKKVKLDKPYNEALEELKSIRAITPIYMGKEMDKERKLDLSIIIPIYNSEKYIKECLDSILNQNIEYTFEIICINDGSTDNSLQVINSYKASNMIVINQKNRGVSNARNNGLAISKGKYILFVDSDDFLPPGAINKMIKKAIETGADVVMGDVGKSISSGKVIIYPNTKEDIQTNNILTACNLRAGTAWGKMFKSNLWEKIRFFEGYSFEDIVISMDIFPQCRKFYIIGEAVYCFRSSKSSLFKRDKNSPRKIDSLWGILGSIDKAREYHIKITDEYYQLLLWHASKMLYDVLSDLEEKYLQDAFIVVAEWIAEYSNGFKKEIIFKGNNKTIYNLLWRSFKEKDFILWKRCCKILIYSGDI